MKNGLTAFLQLLSPDMLQSFDVGCNEPFIANEMGNVGEPQQIEMSSELDFDLIKFLSSDLLENASSIDHHTNLNVTHTYLPQIFSQGQINGRNSSNVCSVISLLVGDFVTKSKVLENGFSVERISQIDFPPPKTKNGTNFTMFHTPVLFLH